MSSRISFTMKNRKNRSSIFTQIRKLLSGPGKEHSSFRNTTTESTKVTPENILDEIHHQGTQIDIAAGLVNSILKESVRRKTFTMDYVPVDFSTSSIDAFKTEDPLLQKLVLDYIGVLNELNILLDFSYAKQGIELLAPEQSLGVSVENYLINLMQNLKEAKEMNSIIEKALSNPGRSSAGLWN